MSGLLEMVTSSDYTGSKLDLLLLQALAGLVSPHYAVAAGPYLFEIDPA